MYGIALGYEDLSDHDQLRIDPLYWQFCARRKTRQGRIGEARMKRERHWQGRVR
ncbi:MAG: hypothetical protein HRF42_09920 [Candidatus Brocadia sp.]